MALVLAHQAITTTADPTTELQVALKAFQDALSSDQRQLFAANTTTPDAESVTLFVANTAAQNQGARGKFLWKRLCTFLQATQQFTSIVDTFVSSNPAVAALVWGGVKTAITTASNAATYFEQVTGLIMEIGRISPTFNEFGRLYTDHKGVQRALCKFYTVVINVCTHIVVVSQRTTASQFVSSLWNPFQSDFATFLTMLTTASGEVRDQVSLAAKQAAAESSKLLEFDSKANDTHRKLASRFRSDAKAEYEAMARYRNKQIQLQSQTTKDKICQNLSEIDYLKAWRLAIHPTVPNTAQWFKSNDDFRQWRSGKENALLWCSGTMGTGKTVFVANIIADLLEHRDHHEIVCFHLCRSDHAASLSARGILGTISRQMIHDSIYHAETSALDQLLETTQYIECDEIIRLVSRHMKAQNTYYIVIDGLDECEDLELASVSNAIGSWSRNSPGLVKILYSGRPELESRLITQHQKVFSLSLNRSQVESDLGTYIDAILDGCLADQKLTLGDPSLILQIAQSLKNGADGMFLWARFFIGDLCACLSDFEILQVLNQPPKGIRELLDKILTRIDQSTSSILAMRTLQYSLVAKRPLQADEMQEALSVEEGQKLLDRSKMPTDMVRIVSCCRGLLFLDEVEGTIHSVHHSVKTHMFEQDGDNIPRLDHIQADLQLGSICLTYLNYADFETQLTRADQSPSVSIQPIDLAVVPITSHSKAASRMARRLLLYQSRLQAKDMKELKREAEDLSETLWPTDSSQGLKHYRFHAYAEAHWLDHFETVKCNPGSSPTNKSSFPSMSVHSSDFFHKVVRNEGSRVRKPWMQEYVPPFCDDWRSSRMQSLLHAVRRDNHVLFAYALLPVDDISRLSELLDFTGQHCFTSPTLFMALWILICCYYKEAALRLNPPTGLQSVFALLDTDLIDYLISWGSTTNVGFDVQSALGIAMKIEGNDLVHKLLQAGADPLHRANGITALETSIDDGKCSMIETILDWISGAPLIENIHSYLYSNAYTKGNFNVVETVLTKQMQVTPGVQVLLNCACEDGQWLIVSNLLHNTSGIPLSILNDSLKTALGHQNPEIVELLLKGGADPNHRFDGRAILLHAITTGNDQIVQMLLDRGAHCSDLSDRSPSSLDEQLLQGQIEVIGEIIQTNPASTNRSIGKLVMAIWRSDSESVKNLSPIYYSVFRNQPDWAVAIDVRYYKHGAVVNFKIFKGLIKEGIKQAVDNIMQAMQTVVKRGYTDVFDVYLAAGFNPNHRFGNYPLITLAAKAREELMVDTLVQKGAAVNWKHPAVEPIVYAIRSNSDFLTEFLLKHGASPNTQCYGFAALEFARLCRAFKSIKRLREYGAHWVYDDQYEMGIDDYSEDSDSSM